MRNPFQVPAPDFGLAVLKGLSPVAPHAHVLKLKNEFPLITLPLLILHGTADKATKPTGSQLFYDTAGSTDKTLKFYDGHFHDLLNDVDKEVVMGDIETWIDARVASPSSEIPLSAR